MAQLKIFGLREHLHPISEAFSEALHTCVCNAFQLPGDKRFHRFILLNRSEFFYPNDRSEKYTIIEISMFEGRSIEAKRSLYRSIYRTFHEQFDIEPKDIEITILETPKHNWGIRGVSGDELGLNYTVEV